MNLLRKGINFFILFLLIICSSCGSYFFSQKSTVQNTSNVLSSKTNNSLVGTQFQLDHNELAVWHIDSPSNLNFSITVDATPYVHGQVMISNIVGSKYTFSATDLAIQDAVIYNGLWYDVTEIAPFTFADLKLLTGNLYLGNTLKSIPDGCFGSATGLTTTTIIIPSTVTFIGDFAFNNIKSVNTYKICNTTDVVQVGDDSFGFDFAIITVPKKFYNQYKSNHLLSDYYIMEFADAHWDMFLMSLNTSTRAEIDITNDKTYYPNIISCGSDVDTVNPKVFITYWELGERAMLPNWITFNQASNNTGIDIHINKMLLPLFPTNFAFLLTCQSVDNLNVMASISFIVKTSSSSLPTANYTNCIVGSQVIDKWQTPIIYIKRPQNITATYVNSFDLCFLNNNWPPQKSEIVDCSIDREIVRFCHFDITRSSIIITPSIPTGKYLFEFIAQFNPADPLVQFSFYINIWDDASSNKTVILATVIPISVIATAAAIFVPIFVIKRKGYKKHRNKNK